MSKKDEPSKASMKDILKKPSKVANTPKRKLLHTVKGKAMLVILIILVSATLAGVGIIAIQGQIVEQEHMKIAQEVERDFEIFVEADTKMLSSTLDVLLQDENFMQVYLAGDRQALYNYGQPLFNQLKTEYEITHFYFIRPDGTCFARIHNPNKYDDQINRFTFLGAQETKQITSGLELGKTAYALRVVKPYYNEGQLIGYLEVGKEVDIFLENLRAGEGHQHALIVEKQYLSETDWTSTRENAGLPNNWDDLEDHVVIHKTLETNDEGACFNSRNVGRVEAGETLLTDITIEGREYQCSGFIVTDAGGRPSGAILSLVDHTEAMAMIGLLRNAVIMSVIFFAGLAIMLWFGIFKNITESTQKLYDAIQQIKKGNFSKKLDIKSGDELEDLGEAFNAMSDTLGKLDDEKKKIEHAKTEFMSITSHEMRSPMTPMRGQLQLLLAGTFGKLSQKQTDSLDIVLRNATRLDGIIQDFLEVSRIEAARLKFEFKKGTNLNEHITRLATEMKQFMPEKKITISTNLAKVAAFEVDPDRVMQILRNLTNNALKFTPENGKIEISTEKQGKYLLFKVRDTGIGISPENQSRIFEPFFQEEQTMYREHGGTGLGLAICRGIAEAQGGKIWLESQKGRGTTFFFTIPFKPVYEIKPIKLLFSKKEDIEEKLELVFTEMLGPIGKSEVVSIKVKGLVRANINEYIDEITKHGIINKESNLEFKQRVARLFGASTSRTSMKELQKQGMLAAETEDKRSVRAVGVSLSELQKTGQVESLHKSKRSKSNKVTAEDFMKKK
jgi:signal transduction histidine kinase